MQLRQEWQDPNLYKELFGKNVDIAKSHQVQELKRKLAILPQNLSHYTIAAYGSLMAENDIPRTLGRDYTIEMGLLYGYKRIFNLGRMESGSYLNIFKTNDMTDNIVVNLITVPFEKIPNYILRESWYEPVMVKCIGEDFQTVDAITVISDTDDFGIEPMLNYTHMCLQGAKSLFGIQGAKCMLDNTLCYSSNSHGYVTLREWLEEVDLVNLMIKQSYTNR